MLITSNIMSNKRFVIELLCNSPLVWFLFMLGVIADGRNFCFIRPIYAPHFTVKNYEDHVPFLIT